LILLTFFGLFYSYDVIKRYDDAKDANRH